MKKRKIEFVVPPEERKIICSCIKTLEFRTWLRPHYRSPEGAVQIYWKWLLINGEAEVAAAPIEGDTPGILLGKFISEFFIEYVKSCCAGEHRGLVFFDDEIKRAYWRYHEGLRVRIDGGSGFDSMEKILRALGFYLGVPIVHTNDLVVYRFQSCEGTHGEVW